MIRISGIIEDSIVDGEGLRYVVFLQGCKHACHGCQNMHTWDFNGGNEIDTTEVYQAVLDNKLLSGLTLSGGDPFFQASNLLHLCKALKEKGVNIWAYTGFSFDDFLNFRKGCKCDEKVEAPMIELLNYIDVVVDGKFIESLKTLEKPYAGSSNQRIVDVQASLEQNKVIEYDLEE